MLNLNTTRIYVHNLPRRAKYMNGKVSINKKNVHIEIDGESL